MNKLLVTLFAGLVATSAFAADAAKPAAAPAAAPAAQKGMSGMEAKK